MTDPENPKSKLETEKAKIYASYGIFRDAVSLYVEKYTGFVNDTNADSAFVNKGQNTAVFLIERDGKEYVAKIPTARRESYTNIVDEEVEASSRVAGIPGYERVVAASPEGIIVSEKIEGSDLADISSEDLSRITGEQIDSYVEAIIAGHARGISIDPKPANVMYSPDKGFTIIDFGTQKNVGDDYKHSPNKALSWGIEPFIQGGLGDGDRGDTITDSNKISEIAKLKLRIIEKYIKSAELHLSSTANKNLDPYLDTLIRYVQRQAFDMEGLIKESEAIRIKDNENRRTYNASKNGAVDDFIDAGWGTV